MVSKFVQHDKPKFIIRKPKINKFQNDMGNKKGTKSKVAGNEVVYPGVSDFDDEVGEFEAVTDGFSGGGHVAREPVDVPTAFGEPHFT